jgi:hypothetical protein
MAIPSRPDHAPLFSHVEAKGFRALFFCWQIDRLYKANLQLHD